MGFGDLINLPQEQVGNQEEARFSFLKGGYVEDFENQENNVEEEREDLALANATEKALQLRDNCNSIIKGGAKSGAEFFANRTYQGLNIPDENTTPQSFVIGRKGRAVGYEDENNKH